MLLRSLSLVFLKKKKKGKKEGILRLGKKDKGYERVRRGKGWKKGVGGAAPSFSLAVFKRWPHTSIKCTPPATYWGNIGEISHDVSRSRYLALLP